MMEFEEKLIQFKIYSIELNQFYLKTFGQSKIFAQNRKIFFKKFLIRISEGSLLSKLDWELFFR